MALDGLGGDAFGLAVSLTAVSAVVGAPRAGGGGAVYVFDLLDGLPPGQRNPHLVAPGGHFGDDFGASVAHDDRVLAVGAPGANVDGLESAGRVYVFRSARELPSGWQLVAEITSTSPAPGGHFGYAVSLDGDVLAVGAPGENVMGEGSGAVHLFRAVQSPRVVVRLAVPSLRGDDEFGYSLALEGTTLVVGAPGTAGDVGAAYVYEVTPEPDLGMPSFEALAVSEVENAEVNALVEDPEGYLLLGTVGGDLVVFDGEGSRVYRHDPDDPDSIASGSVLTLRVDRRGRCWIGTESGLDRFDRAEDRFAHYRLGGDSVTAEPVVAVLEDRDGAIWTGSNGRLFRYDEEEDRFVEHTAFDGQPEVLDETYVSGIQQDSAGALWVLIKHLRQNHASLYRVEGTRVERFPLSADWGQVGPLLVDSRDRFWLKAPAPADFDPARDTTVRPSTTPAYVLHWAAAEDPGGTVWIATHAGVFRQRSSDAIATLLRVGGGAAPPGPWDTVRSLHRLASGTWVLGTARGVFRMRPAVGADDAPAVDADGPRSALQVLVTRVETSGREGRRELLGYGRRRVEVDHDESFGFEFSRIDLTSSRAPRLRYRLRGLEPDWVDPGDRRLANYASVPPGSYRFDVQAVSDDGGVLAATQVAVSVTPAFWQTWWFSSLAVTTLVGLLVIGYRVRTDHLIELERIRLRIADDLHDDLSSHLSGIALLGEQMTRDPALEGQARDAVDTITATSRRMLRDLRDLVWLVDPARDSAADTVEKMRATAETLLAGRSTFQADVAGALAPIGMLQRRELLLIYKELLHNVARHAEAEHVSIRLSQRDGRILLRVTDDGQGFDPSVASSGHGLKSLHARAARVGGELCIESTPGRGTDAFFEMPA